MLLFLFFFLNLFTNSEQNSIEKRPEFVNIFESNIYTTYLNQRDAYLATQAQALQEMEQESSYADLYTLLACKGERGALYQTKTMLTLREALTAKPSPTIQQFLDDYIEWLFGTADLERPCRQFIVQNLPINFKEIATSDRKNAFMTVHNVVMQQQKFTGDKKSGRELLPEDNFLYGDFPSYLFNFGETEVIRTSNVIHDLTVDRKGKTTSAAVNPEFYHYVKTLTSKGEKHLYINLLSREGHEQHKTFALEALENDPTVKAGLIVVTLDKEKTSSFYEQCDNYAHLNDAGQFKQTLLEKLIEPNGAYYWSQQLDPQEWTVTLSSLIDQVHLEFFQNLSTLDCSSRQDFIDFLYIKIVETLTDKFHPKRLNITCKQAVDRGPTTYALLYLYKQSKHGPLQPQDIEQALYYAFVPPLAYHDRATHVYRIERLQNAANRLP